MANLMVKDLMSDLEKGDRSLEVIKEEKPKQIMPQWAPFLTLPPLPIGAMQQQAMLGQSQLGMTQGISPLAQILGGGR